LQSAVDSGAFEDPELQAVEDPQAALAQTTTEVVGETVKAWMVGREDLRVLFLVDRSAATDAETVEYGGESLTAGDAAVRAAIATVEGMKATSMAGLWEYGVDAGDGGAPYRSVADMAELSNDARTGLIADLNAVSENGYEGGSPLYDTIVEAAEFMNGEAAGDALSVIVVLTNVSQDDVSSATAEETATELAGLGGPAVVYTVGFGVTEPDKLTAIAEATDGEFIRAPAEGGVLSQIGG
jgi:hypothetical protein